jgi:hypothetical protein
MKPIFNCSKIKSHCFRSSRKDRINWIRWLVIAKLYFFDNPSSSLQEATSSTMKSW